MQYQIDPVNNSSVGITARRTSVALRRVNNRINEMLIGGASLQERMRRRAILQEILRQRILQQRLAEKYNQNNNN